MAYLTPVRRRNWESETSLWRWDAALKWKKWKEQLPFREAMIALCSEWSFRTIMVTFLFLCSQSSEGWIGQEQAGSHSKIALCLCSEYTSSWCNTGDLSLRVFFSISTQYGPGCISPAANSHKNSALLAKLSGLRIALHQFRPLKVKKSAVCIFTLGFGVTQ